MPTIPGHSPPVTPRDLRINEHVERFAVRLQSAYRGSRARTEHGFVLNYDPYEKSFDFRRPLDVETSWRNPSPAFRKPASDDGSPDIDDYSSIIQVGGHGTITPAHDAPGVVKKQVPYRELRAFESVQGTPIRKCASLV